MNNDPERTRVSNKSGAELYAGTVNDNINMIAPGSSRTLSDLFRPAGILVDVIATN